jgi:hypothetical protein
MPAHFLSYAGHIDKFQSPITTAREVAGAKIIVNKTLVVESATIT